MFRLEHVPLVIGALIAIAGAGLVYDARREEGMRVLRERRRRARASRNRAGEALVGVGIVLFGASLIGRDNWRYGTVAVIAGFALVLTGGVMNRAYLRELLLFRGAARRAGPGETRRERPPDDDYPKPRIR